MYLIVCHCAGFGLGVALDDLLLFRISDNPVPKTVIIGNQALVKKMLNVCSRFFGGLDLGAKVTDLLLLLGKLLKPLVQNKLLVLLVELVLLHLGSRSPS